MSLLYINPFSGFLPVSEHNSAPSHVDISKPPLPALVLPHTPCILALQHFGSLMKHAYAYLWAFACALCPTLTQPKLPFKPQLGCYFFKEAFLSGPVLVRDTDPSTGLQWHLLLPCVNTYTACNGPLTCLSPSPDSGLWEDRAPI